MPQGTAPLIRLRFGMIETDTPYSERWVQAVKAVVPPHFREWNGACWLFDKSCYLLVREITLDEWGDITVDLVDSSTLPPQFKGWAERWETYKRRRESSGSGAGYDSRTGNEWDGRERRTGWGDPRRMNPNPYAVLHLLSDAPWEVVQAAYRALVKLYHPDRGEGGDTARMQAVNIAYDTIKGQREKRV